jgi:hypothetical protein
MVKNWYKDWAIWLAVFTLLLLMFAMWELLPGRAPVKVETSTGFDWGDRDRGIINDADIEQRQQVIEEAIIAERKAKDNLEQVTPEQQELLELNQQYLDAGGAEGTGKLWQDYWDEYWRSKQ